MTLPTIDLERFYRGSEHERRELGRQVDEICATIGFFTITGHGVAPELLVELETVADAFFAMPETVKRRSMSQEAEVNRGYAPALSEALSYSVGIESPPDLFEAFNTGLSRGLDLGSLSPTHAVLHVDNIWPDEPPELRPVLERYMAEMSRLAQDVLRLLATALDLDPEFFAGRAERSPDVLRAINYLAPEEGTATSEGQFRLGAHSDYGVCTILHADPVPGLQILTLDDEWLDVTPVPGSFLVNLGDVLAAWTNDHWRSTVHRVMPPDPSNPAPRRSFPYFHEADVETVVDPIARFVTAERPRRYDPFVVGDHLHAKIVGPRLMKAAQSTQTADDRQLS